VELHDYIRVARKRWWMVVASVAAALILSTLITIKAVPTYATSVTFFVTTPDTGVADAYQGGLFSQQRVKSYSTLLTGKRLAAQIAASPGIRLDAREVRKRITAQAVPETVLLQATVTDSSRARSELIASALARAFKTQVETLETPPGERAAAVKVEVVEGPDTADDPVSPRPVRNLVLAALLGLLAGAAGALLREVLDTTVKTAESLQQIAGAPVLAGVPYDSDAKDGPMTLITEGHSPRFEALRQLRTNLQYVDVDRPVKTLVVTSAMPGEGKSSTACGLAMLLADTGRRVLILDADLRRPRIADYLGLEGAAGLTTVLAGKVKIDEVLQRFGEHLWVLPSGALPPNPSELLGSQHMADLLDELRGAFDTIVIDCPPLLPVTDAAVVAARADGALLMARSRRTTTAQVTGAVRALRSVDARLLGCVLNMVPASGPEAYYYHDGYAPKGRTGIRRTQRSDLPVSLPAHPTAAPGRPKTGAAPGAKVGSAR
jgi:capsular exopolysaccharide synthesis family protein